jgi:two-component system, NtrC family, response regulator HydG
MVDWNSILVISPDQRTLEMVTTELSSDGYKVVRAASEAEVHYCLQRTTAFSGVIVDLSLGERWLALLEDIANILPAKPIIALIPQANLKLAIQALQHGAYDYLLKPVLAEEVLTVLVANLGRALHEPIQAARRNKWARERFLRPIESQNQTMRENLQMMGILARTDAHMLISGEDGTGKTFFSRVIHFCSPRRFEPLVVLDCRGKTSGELLLELFGTVGGILISQRGGTLILRNCPDMAASVQNRLITFLDDMENTTAAANYPRIIGTVQTTAEERLESQLPSAFQKKIGIGRVEIAALRDRMDDVPVLADAFLAQTRQEFELEPRYLSARALSSLRRMDWRENARGLQRLMQRAAVLTDNSEISEEEIFTASRPSAGRPAMQLDLTSLHMEEVEEVLIGQALQRNAGNMSRTAATLGISRGTLYNKIRKYRLENLSSKSAD